MLLDRVKQRKHAIMQIGREAAERAATLGLEPVNAVYSKPKTRPVVGRMTANAEISYGDVMKQSHPQAGHYPAL